MANPLLPPELEAARAAVPIVDSLPAPGYATPRAPNNVRAMRSLESIYARSGVLAHVGLGPDEAWVATDKTFPHALYELMIMSSGESILPGLHDHSPAFEKSMGAMAAVFAEHCDAWRLSPVISWSYDPVTVDRESIQGEKRLHTHFIGRTAEELDVVRRQAVPAAQSPLVRQRRIVEEASVLAGVLAADCLDPAALRTLEPVPPLSSPAATATIQLRVRDGWAALAEPDLFQDLRTVHKTLRTIYDRVAEACFIGESGPWRRPGIDPSGVDAIDLPLGDRAREALGHYLQGMRPELLNDTDRLRNPDNRDWTTHVYPLADLAYSVCFSSHQGDLYAHVRVNVFSDLGGAGMSVLDGTVVKTRKGEHIMTPQEEAQRIEFQREFLDVVRLHPLGAQALFPLAPPGPSSRRASQVAARQPARELARPGQGPMAEAAGAMDVLRKSRGGTSATRPAGGPTPSAGTGGTAPRPPVARPPEVER